MLSNQDLTSFGLGKTNVMPSVMIKSVSAPECDLQLGSRNRRRRRKEEEKEEEEKRKKKSKNRRRKMELWKLIASCK